MTSRTRTRAPRPYDQVWRALVREVGEPAPCSSRRREMERVAHAAVEVHTATLSVKEARQGRPVERPGKVQGIGDDVVVRCQPYTREEIRRRRARLESATTEYAALLAALRTR